MFRFENPYLLLLLLLVPLLVLYRKHRHAPRHLGVSTTLPVAGLPTGPVVAVARLLPAIKYAVLCLMILALARPQWGTHEVSVRTKGIDIILAVDLSGSMAALDFSKDGRIINRLQAAKSVIGDFISKRSGDRIGLVVFGTHAYTQLPLTRDYNALMDILDRIKIGAAGQNTAIGDAIGISIKRLEHVKGKSKVIILLTDGVSNSGVLSPEAATEIAAQKGIKIYTIGIGGNGRAPFRVNIPGFGERYVYQQVDMDATALKHIAKKTHGLFFRATDTKGLEKIYNTINRLEKTEAVVKTYDNYRDLYAWWLMPAFGLLGIWLLLANTRFLRVP